MPADRGKKTPSIVVRSDPIAKYADPKYKWPCTWGQCDSWFTREHDVKRHIGNVHLKERHECTYAGCIYSATQESNLTAHINKVHKNNERPYFCFVPGCTKAYGDPSAISRHKKRCIDEYCAQNSLDAEEFRATLPGRKKGAGKRYPNVPAHVERILESDDPNPATAATQFGSFLLKATPPVLPAVPAMQAVPVPPIVALADREPSPDVDEVDELFDTPEPPSLALPSPAASQASSSSSILCTPLCTPQLDVKQEIKVEDPLHWVWDNYFDLTAAADSPVLPPVSLPAVADVKPDVADLLPASNSTGNLFGRQTTTVNPALTNQPPSQTTFVDPTPVVHSLPSASNVPVKMEAPAPVNVKMEEMPVMLSAPVKAEHVTDVHLNLGGFSNLNGNEFMSQAFAGMQQPFQPSLSPSMFMHNPMPMPNSMPPHNSMSMHNSIPMPNFAMGMGLPNSAMFPATNEFVPQYNYGNGMPMPQFIPRPQPLSANPYAHLLFNPNPLANQFSNHQGFF